MNLTKEYKIDKLIIEFNEIEIEQLRWLLNHSNDVAKLIAKKEKLLEHGQYGLHNLLETVRKNLDEKLYGDNVRSEVNETHKV